MDKNKVPRFYGPRCTCMTLLYYITGYASIRYATLYMYA